MRWIYVIGTMVLLVLGGAGYGWSRMHARGYS